MITRKERKTYLPQSRITQNPLTSLNSPRHGPTTHPQRQRPHDPANRLRATHLAHQLCAQRRARALGMAVHRLRHVLPQLPDILFDSRRTVIEARVGTERPQALMMRLRRDGDDVRRRVEDAGELQDVHPRVGRGAVDEQLFCRMREGGGIC